MAQVRGQVQDSLGLELRMGFSTLPEVDTFDGLVEAAYSDMKRVTRHIVAEEAPRPRATSVQGQVTSQ